MSPGAATRGIQGAPLAGLVAMFLALVPVVAALRLTGHGGGYTIDEWGIWAAATVVAAGVGVLGQPHSRLSGVQRLFPLALLGLALWSLVSVHWAAWPQSALVESDRYLFYAAAATLPLVLVPGARWRRVLVGAVATGAALPALLVALKLWQSGNAGALFDGGRLVGSVGYGGGLAAAVAIAVWPLVAFASDRGTARPLRPLAAFGAGIALATVVPTEARASVWALAVSALVFFALCPTPIRSGTVAAGAVLPTLLLWHPLNGVFSSATGGHPHSVGLAILLTGLVSAFVTAGQVVVDELVTLPAQARQAVAIAATVWLFLVVLGGGVAALAVTDGHPVAWTRHTLERTVDRVGGENGQAAGEGQAGSRFASLDTGRYDLWKVALRGFRERPSRGVGAGNFGYLNVRIGRPFLFPFQAHSQLLEVASTLGLPGLALFAIVLGLPFAACVWVRLRAPSTGERLLAAGIGGSLGYFAAHGQVDWIWQLSSCALPAVMLGAVAVAMLPPARERTRSFVMGGIAAAAAVAAAVVLILPAALAQRYLERSYREPAAAALDDARRAGDLDRLSGRPDLAAARARLRTGDTAGALTDARRAAGAEPGFWVAWQLLSVAAAREGERTSAASAQARVRRLAPRLPLELRGEVPAPGFDHY
ncbi:MAG TPA: O-antigen ligase family protein [Gaiellales bacterium]